MEQNDFFRKYPKCAVAFSGGVDSAYLLYAAKKCGAQVEAYYIKTEFQPEFEYADAVRLCRELGVRLHTVPCEILAEPAVAANPADRCYHCKKVLFTLLAREAKKDGYPVLLDGTNASDDAADRPGMRALRELSVLSPLRLCGLTKVEIRRRSREAGLFTWDKPAYACLATRIPTGRPITRELLENVEASEKFLSALGFSDFRVRVYGGAARIQVKDGQFIKAAEARGKIAEGLRPYFSAVFLDTETR